MAKAKDPKALLAEIEQEESKLFADFEAKMKEQREKKLAAHLKPLREERAANVETRTNADARIVEIDKEIAALTGEKQRREKGGKRATRMSESDKMEIAKVLYDKMAASRKNEFSAQDLAQFATVNGRVIPPRELVVIWNKGHKPAEQIVVKGAKSLTRYSVP